MRKFCIVEEGITPYLQKLFSSFSSYSVLEIGNEPNGWVVLGDANKAISVYSNYKPIETLSSASDRKPLSLTAVSSRNARLVSSPGPIIWQAIAPPRACHINEIKFRTDPTTQQAVVIVVEAGA